MSDVVLAEYFTTDELTLLFGLFLLSRRT